MLAVPAVTSAVELQGILEREAVQVQEDAAEGQNEDYYGGGDCQSNEDCQGSGGTAEAEGEQPGGEGDDGAGIMPCGDFANEEEDDKIDIGVSN